MSESTKPTENLADCGNKSKPLLADVLDYVKEKIKIVQEMEKEDKGLDYNHSSFLSGLSNAYEDIRFQLEDGFLKNIC